MTDTEAQRPTEPVLAAIEPFWRKTISVYSFYWKMAWRPRQFAEEYLLVPTPESITKVVKHTLWLAGFTSAMVSVLGSIPGLLGLGKLESPPGFLITFLVVLLAAFHVIPMAGVLWTLTKRYHASISQAILLFINTFNIILASTLILYIVGTIFYIPWMIFVYFGRFLRYKNTEHDESFADWFFTSAYSKTYTILFGTVVVSWLFVCGYIFLFSAPELIAGTIKTSYWRALWRFLVSVLVPLIAIDGLFILIVASTIILIDAAS
jgi:hypothetical protein